MKKILVAAAALLWAGTGSAQVPHHAPAQLNCSECHVMHASRAHNYDGTTTVNARYNQGTGHAKLLVADGTNATCLACHDSEGGGTNTDVFQTGSGALLGQRSAGGLNGTVPGKTPDAAYLGYMGHTLGSAAAPPGWDTTKGVYAAGTEGFNCSHCHAVHGGAADAFRNLGGTQWMGPAPLFGDAASSFLTAYPTIPTAYLAAGVINTQYDVMQWASADRPFSGGSSKDARNVVYGKGSGNVNGANGMNRYCANCHGNFHGDSTTNVSGENLKHPTTGSNDVVARMTTGGAQFNVTRPVYTADDRTAGEVGCLSCHKAHGNQHSYALIWPANGTAEVATTNREEGAGTVFQSLCKTCHPQASAF